jgi:acetyltransferase-like isoleucine patch superfamily enzyme
MDILPFNKFHLGDNSTIEDFTTINNGVGDIYIGDRTRIGLGCTLIGPVRIGNDIRLAQNIVMSGLNHNYEDIALPISDQGVTTSPITIEDETWLGANCVVLPGVTIGKHCVIAAGSIVTKDIPPYSVAAGNPARVLKQYNPETKFWERKTG